MAVGLYNSDNKPRNITADIAEVLRGYTSRASHSSADASANVRDVWQRKELGLFTGKYTAHDVDVHETKVLKFTKAKAPWTVKHRNRNRNPEWMMVDANAKC